MKDIQTLRLVTVFQLPPAAKVKLTPRQPHLRGGLKSPLLGFLSRLFPPLWPHHKSCYAQLFILRKFVELSEYWYAHDPKRQRSYPLNRLPPGRLKISQSIKCCFCSFSSAGRSILYAKLARHWKETLHVRGTRAYCWMALSHRIVMRW